MITDAELRRTAASWNSDPMIVDLDYVLGAFLSQWYGDAAASALRFKGGTCLRKCYFPRHRFSEDLDFTAETEIGSETISALIDRTVHQMQEVFGIDLEASERRERVLKDGAGGVTQEITLYYRGPLRRTGAPRSIKLHITDSRSEFLASPVEVLEIMHPYSDAELMAGVRARCYSLQEILAEKLRALSGQRQFAISRDLYDVHCLLLSGKISLESAKSLMVPKLKAKGIRIADIRLDDFAARREEFEQDWQRNLEHLLASPNEVDFQNAWQTAITSIEWMLSIQ